MKFVQIIVLPLILVLTACGKNEAPNCSDKQTTNLIKEIVIKELKSVNRYNPSMVFTVKDIRTIGKNKELGSYSCASNLEIFANNVIKKIPITYTSELADDNKNFYVNVYYN